jgi:hypothetical protein
MTESTEQVQRYKAPVPVQHHDKEKVTIPDELKEIIEPSQNEIAFDDSSDESSEQSNDKSIVLSVDPIADKCVYTVDAHTNVQVQLPENSKYIITFEKVKSD